MKETNEDIDLEIKALEDRKSKLLKLAQLRREVCKLEKNKMCASDNSATVKKVATEVCQKFNVTFDRLTMKCRENAVAVPRQVVFYIARELSDIRLAELGRIFHKDHGTVLYGHRSVKDRMTVDREFAETVEQLMQSCRQRLASEIVAAN
ncbi:MAG: helix-turn-helix domain-containing protein [Limisphaerales bacterium]